MIELINVSKTFNTEDGELEAVKDVSLHIHKGDIYGIIGLSGAGKSTLVRCMNFLEVPTGGDVKFQGVSLSSLSHKELLLKRRSISMIFQGFNLLSQRNVLKNVCYPLEIAGVPRAEAEKKAISLLKVVGLQDRLKAYPAQLSGGQKQRVAIARALATDPEVLLCDEATSALDPNTTRAILDLLKEINETMGVTIVVITHEMKVVEKICNRVAVLDHGVVAEEGLVSDIFTGPKSDIARELILPKSAAVSELKKGKMIRVIFDGQESDEPFISNLSIQCSAAVCIMGANTEDIGGKAYGQILLRLPEDPAAEARIMRYMTEHNTKYEIVEQGEEVNA
ncbi:MAG: methionine ABC transporter ATP-binding protein [Lachnospiraceae bacterium]|nr:methionine ABC transporter ATP-binding protein [Lachnospiraceae bacterium]